MESVNVIPHPETPKRERANLSLLSRCRIKLNFVTIKRDNKHEQSARILTGYRNGKVKD